MEELELIHLLQNDLDRFERWVSMAPRHIIETQGVEMLEVAVSEQNVDAIHILIQRVPPSSGAAQAIAQRLFDEGIDEHGQSLQALVAGRTMVAPSLWPRWQVCSIV